MQGPIEAHVKLCGDCPKWIPGKITYPLGRIGICRKSGKQTTKTTICKEVEPVKIHECGDMPSGVSIILDTDGEPTVLSGVAKVRCINLCPWCGVRLVKEA